MPKDRAKKKKKNVRRVKVLRAGTRLTRLSFPVSPRGSDSITLRQATVIVTVPLSHIVSLSGGERPDSPGSGDFLPGEGSQRANVGV